MDSYNLLLDMARATVPTKRIQFRGGLTNGRIVDREGPTKKNSMVSRAHQGQSYARRFREDDDKDEDFEQMEKAVSTMKHGPPVVTYIDDVTSSGTLDHQCLLNPSSVTVYESYSFERDANSSAAKLPIHQYEDTILGRIESHPVVIIKGPTGCGKSTQVPQYILDEARKHGMFCNIVITQPRKIAAISLAERVCQERSWRMGTVVGYQIALDKVTSDDTRITFCTAGVLLQQLISHPTLSNFTHVIIDEVHERDSETDFLLIVIKKLMRVHGCRTKLILMSATMKIDKFAQYFTRRIHGDLVEPPVVELPSHNNFEVLKFYIDNFGDKLCQIKSEIKISEPKIDSQLYEVASMLVEVFHSIDADDPNNPGFLGAVLIFLPGIAEIDQMYTQLQIKSDKARLNRDRNFEEWMICPMHSTMSFDEQRKVFMKPRAGTRKIILATNIAESSITVADVKYVIDFCLTKHQVQDNDTFYSSLQLSWVSKSQATQRAGRVGRTMAGRVYRFVPKWVFEDFDDDCDPEILRSPLDRLILKAKELNMGPPVAILGSAIDPPDLSNIQRTILNLKEMGALTLKTNGVYDEEDGDLTFTGRVMAALPLDTQLSKLILVGHMMSMLRECVIMACCMSGRHIFANPLKERMKAFDTKIAWSEDSKSDPITYFYVYKCWESKESKGEFMRSGGQSEQEWGKRMLIQLKSLKEVKRLQDEVMKRLENLGIVDGKIPEVDRNANLQALLLRICIAGAFYPNYFVHVPVEEKEAVKILGNRDPYRTVYLKRFPQNQPGPLYRDSIRQLLQKCGSGIKVQFDGSAKVYVEFGNSLMWEEGSERAIVGEDLVVPGQVVVPGEIMKAVYRAVKMRQLGFPMTIPMLSPAEAQKRAADAFGENLSPYDFAKDKWTKSHSRPAASVLPGLSVSHVRVEVTHVVDPSNFYVALHDKTKAVWIYDEINRRGEGVLMDLDPHSIKPEMPCVASYTSSKDAPMYYRAKVVSIKYSRATVFFIDYGNVETIEVSLIKGYGGVLIKKGIQAEPALCIPCRLAEIQPVAFTSGKSEWQPAATERFRQCFENNVADARIYSIVNGVMALYLFPASDMSRQYKIANEESFNHLLVACNMAQFMEEPYLSKENNAQRTQAQENPGAACTNTLTSAMDDHQLYLDNVHFPSPTFADTRKTHNLLGPYSPLEMTVTAMTRKCLEKSASVDQSSVNSVLLDNNPMDTSSRLIVAGTVHQSAGGNRLILRNTTIMPSIRGIVGLMCLIFSPKSELRVDSERTHITGALCGLGHDEKGRSYDQENDVEVSFDCKFDIDDILKINKLRYWMNMILCSSPSDDVHSTSKAKQWTAQRRITELLKDLVTRTKRPLLNPLGSAFPEKYEWNQVPVEFLILPTIVDDRVYPLIWSVALNPLPDEEEKEKLKRNLKQLERYSRHIEPMKKIVSCEICQTYLETPDIISTHLSAAVHLDRVIDIFGNKSRSLDRRIE